MLADIVSLLTKQALCVQPQLPTLALLTGQLLLAEILSTKVAIIGPAAFSNNFELVAVIRI